MNVLRRPVEIAAISGRNVYSGLRDLFSLKLS